MSNEHLEEQQPSGKQDGAAGAAASTVGNDRTVPPELLRTIHAIQQTEITEYEVYRRLAAGVSDENNASVLQRIAEDEKRHAQFWRRWTGKDARPHAVRMRWYVFLARLLGLTFALKLMERNEEKAQQGYERLAAVIPEARRIAAEEERHEKALLDILDEERLRYAGSVVLGLNDALVELTGALAGLTLALRDTRLIALTGLVTGLAAALSMAASEYLSTKSEPESGKQPGRAAVYTGIAYLVTVAVLIFPYLVLGNYLLCLVWTAANAILVIWLFTYYLAVARDLPLMRRFLEMAGISLGVAGLSFLIGAAVRALLGVEV